jgi:DNA-binding response OmpR family regulator
LRGFNRSRHRRRESLARWSSTSGQKSSSQQPFRKDDRSVDVYVRKLRHKLELAVPEWRFIHTHFGFGYRFAAELSQDFHNTATAR